MTRLHFVLALTLSAFAIPSSPGALAGGDHSHQHGAMGGHMSHMVEVKEGLQKELGSDYDQVVPEGTEEDLIRGKKTFSQICSVCHGVTGKGDGVAAAGLSSKPANFTDSAHASYYSDRGRLLIIKRGVPGTAMAGFESALSDDERMAVFQYVRSLGESGEAGHDGHKGMEHGGSSGHEGMGHGDSADADKGESEHGHGEHKH